MFSEKTLPVIEMVPFKPVDVWLNWSVSFAGQGLGQWTDELAVVGDPIDDPNYDELTAKERWEKRAAFFGSQLVCSAWRQLFSEARLGDGLLRTSPFHWNGVWDKKSLMNDGFMMKDEMLGKAMTSGRTLPFGSSHEELYKDGHRTAYHAYRRKLDQIVNDVPVQPEFDQRVEEFDIEKLEWLTILLYIGKIVTEKGMCLFEDVSDRAPTSESTSTAEPASTAGLSKPAAWNNNEEIKGSQAVANLRTQVYLSGSSPYSDGRDSELQRISEVFNCLSVGVRLDSKAFLSEANRHVSKIREMIEVWMNLVCGDQIAFMMELNGSSFWEDVCSITKHLVLVVSVLLMVAENPPMFPFMLFYPYVL